MISPLRHHSFPLLDSTSFSLSSSISPSSSLSPLPSPSPSPQFLAHRPPAIKIKMATETKNSNPTSVTASGSVDAFRQTTAEIEKEKKNEAEIRQFVIIATERALKGEAGLIFLPALNAFIAAKKVSDSKLEQFKLIYDRLVSYNTQVAESLLNIASSFSVRVFFSSHQSIEFKVDSSIGLADELRRQLELLGRPFLRPFENSTLQVTTNWSGSESIDFTEISKYLRSLADPRSPKSPSSSADELKFADSREPMSEFEHSVNKILIFAALKNISLPIEIHLKFA